MVEQPPGSGHDDVGSHGKGVHLVLHVVSAVKRGCLEAAGYFADYGGNLHHKLTRRGYDDALYASCGRFQHLEHRQGERKCLARSRG